MTTRRVAHTASFLQTFHTGVTTANRRAAAGAEGSEPFAAPADADAIAFVKGQRVAAIDPSKTTGAVFAQPSASTDDVVEISGYPVKLGNGYVSEKQAKWMIDIATTRVLPTGATAEAVLIRLQQGFAKSAGSQFITTYKDLPKKAPSAAAMEAIAPGADTAEYARIENGVVMGQMTTGHPIPDGRYAIQMADQDKPHFYSVKHGWKPGVIFVDEQASDDRYPVRNRAAREAILSEISKDPEAAGLRYATELGQCRACGRTLTDHANPYFKMGLGPECGKKS
jgi:hypothetical protein